MNIRALVQSTRPDFSLCAISNLGCFFITRNVSKEIERKKGAIRWQAEPSYGITIQSSSLAAVGRFLDLL
jgi:hypothetical protein